MHGPHSSTPALTPRHTSCSLPAATALAALCCLARHKLFTETKMEKLEKRVKEAQEDVQSKETALRMSKPERLQAKSLRAAQHHLTLFYRALDPMSVPDIQ